MNEWILYLSCGHQIHTNNPKLWRMDKVYCSPCRKKVTMDREELIQTETKSILRAEYTKRWVGILGNEGKKA